MTTVLVIVLIALVVLVGIGMYGGVGPNRVRRQRVVVERPGRRVVEEPASEVVDEPGPDVVDAPTPAETYVEERVVHRPVTRTRRTRRIVD